MQCFACIVSRSPRFAGCRLSPDGISQKIRNSCDEIPGSRFGVGEQTHDPRVERRVGQWIVKQQLAISIGGIVDQHGIERSQEGTIPIAAHPADQAITDRPGRYRPRDCRKRRRQRPCCPADRARKRCRAGQFNHQVDRILCRFPPHATNPSANSLPAGLSAGLDRFDQRLGESRDIVGVPACNDIAVRDRFRIDDCRTGVFEVRPDRGPAGRLAPP